MKLEEITCSKEQLLTMPVNGDGHFWKDKVAAVCKVLACQTRDLFEKAHHLFHPEWRRSRRTREALLAHNNFDVKTRPKARRRRNREPFVPHSVRALVAHVLWLLQSGEPSAVTA